MMESRQPGRGITRLTRPRILDGFIETNLPEIHHPINVENCSDFRPADNHEKGARCGNDPAPNRFGSIFPLPCSFFTSFKRLVARNPQPCPAQKSVLDKPRPKNVPRSRPTRCKCPGKGGGEGRRLHLNVVIPERYFSPERNGDYQLPRKRPVKEVVKQAVSDLQSQISEDEVRSRHGCHSAGKITKMAPCQRNFRTSEDRFSRTSASFDGGAEGTPPFDRKRKCSCKKVPQPEKQAEVVLEKKPSEVKPRAVSSVKLVEVVDEPPVAPPPVVERQPEIDSSLAAKLKDLAVEETKEEKQEEIEEEVEVEKVEEIVKEEEIKVEEEVVKQETVKFEEEIVKQEEVTIEPEKVVSVTNYEKESETTVEEDISTHAEIVEKPSRSEPIPPRIEPPPKKEVSAITVVAENVIEKAYSSLTSVVQGVTAVDFNKNTLIGIISLLLFIIGLLLMYLLNRKCIYKKPRIYQGYCHLFQ